MNIVHICIAGPFSDNYSYQENLLAKYHARLGHNVSVITSDIALNQEGKFSIQENYFYKNEDEVAIFRVKHKGGKLARRLKRIEDYSDILNELKAEIIFIHGSQFFDVKPIINYAKDYPTTRIFVDNHADFSNSATNLLSRELLHKIIWRHFALKLEPYVEKFYGVLPARVDFLENVYRIPKTKTELLVLGGDDDYINSIQSQEVIAFKKEHHIPTDVTVIVTGGKIDFSKQEVLYLMEYVRKRKDVYLIIFGNVVDVFKQEFEQLLSDNIVYVGWIDTRMSYLLFQTADIVVFPGRHSVYWEQVVSQKKPMLLKYWDGTTHIDIGGNVEFIDYDYENKEKLFTALDKVLTDNVLNDLKNKAQSSESNRFLYSEIAKYSIK